MTSRLNAKHVIFGYFNDSPVWAYSSFEGTNTDYMLKWGKNGRRMIMLL